MPMNLKVRELVSRKARRNPRPGETAKANPDPSAKAGSVPAGRNPVLPLQRLDPRIPMSTGMVPKGWADDLRVLQGVKKLKRS